MTDTITVSPVLPATPIVVCNAPFLNTLIAVEKEALGLIIASPQDAQNAANMLQRLTTAGSVLEKARQELKAPFIAKGKEIDNAAAGPATRIESAKRLLKSKVAAFDEEQRRIAAETERLRLAELARLEAIQRKEQADRDRKAAELAKQAEEVRKAAELANKKPMLDLDWEEDEPAPVQKTETELAIERVKFAPAPVAAKPTGITYKSTVRIKSIDLKQLPDTFITKTANEAALRATFCTGWKQGQALPECPGVVFEEDRTVASTGRAVF